MVHTASPAKRMRAAFCAPPLSACARSAGVPPWRCTALPARASGSAPVHSLSTRFGAGVRSPYVATSCRGAASLTSSAAAAPAGAGSSGVATSQVRAPGAVLTALSTLVGVLVLVGSVLYKVPQVVRIIRRRSARGISVLMYGLETLGQTFSGVYFARRAFPFSTYGETVFIMLQNVAILALIVRFEHLPRVSALVTGILFALAVAFLASPVAPLRLLITLQVASIPLLNLAKIPQIALNFRRKDTGELSSTTLGLQLLGNVARIFTTVAQVRDPLMLIGTLVATCFNCTLFLQWIYYSRGVRADAVALKRGSQF